MLSIQLAFGQNISTLSLADIKSDLQSKNIISKYENIEIDSNITFSLFRNILNISTYDSIQITKTRFDKRYKTKTIRAIQLHKGIKIYNSDILFYFDKDNFLSLIKGNWYSNINLSSQITIDSSTALRIVYQAIDTIDLFYKNKEILLKHDAKEQDLIPKPNLSYYWDPILNQFLLTWEINIYLTKGGNSKYFIDANSGKLIDKIILDTQCSTGSVSTSWYGVKTIWTWLNNGLYKTRDDCNTTPLYDNYVFNMLQDGIPNGVYYTSTNNTWDISPTEKVGGTLHWCMDQFEQYLRNHHSRDSWDDENSNWIGYSNALIDGSSGNAAFFDQGSASYTAYGYGASTSSPTDDWNTLDIVAHEFTHGIDASEANLFYEDESGALDESFADIFGEIAEKHVLGSNDWLVADVISGMTALRSFSDPESLSTWYGGPMPDTYLGDNWYSGNIDHGGVHHNSSVQNYMFYLLSEGGTGTNDNGDFYTVSGIGINNAREIAYLALVDFVVSNSDLADARDAWLSAVSVAFPGNTSYECTVEDAWYAVGVGPSCSGGGNPDLTISDADLPLGNTYCINTSIDIVVTISNICSGNVNSSTNTGAFLLSICNNSYPPIGSVLDDNTLSVSEMSDDIETENLSFTIPSNTTPGAYYVVVVTDYENDITTECIESNNKYCIPITIITIPSPVSVTGGGTFCNSATLTASGGGGGTIYWQGTTSNGTSTSTPSTSQSVTSSGTYYFRAKNDCGWGTQGSATVIINFAPGPVTVSGGGTFCNSALLTASGGSGGTIYWQGTTSNGTSTSTPSTSEIVNSNGTYYFRANNTCGWGNQGSADVTITPTVVLNTNDNGSGSLRDMVSCATANDIITFSLPLMSQITLTSGQINITKNLTITGPGITNLSISGNNVSRLFHIEPGTTLTLVGMSLKDANSPAPYGGALFVEGSVNLENILFDHNFENTNIPKALTVISPGGILNIIANVEIHD